MKNLLNFSDFKLNEEGSSMDMGEFLSRFGKFLSYGLNKSVHTSSVANNAEIKGDEEPGGSPAEDPIGFGSPSSDKTINPERYDSYGESIGINDKGDTAKLEQPSSGPIGNISNSAYANINVSTRGINGTSRGNLGCAAATSIIFYRATGYALAGSKAVCISTQTIYDDLQKKSLDPGSNWKMIKNWKVDYKPGDIIITRRGSKPGHIGVVVRDGLIISNSSGGFKGDKKGQIEPNYTIKTWEGDVARRNPDKTAIFRYSGPYKSTWT